MKEKSKKKLRKEVNWMRQCKKCGSEKFIVNEETGWKAFIDDEGVLQCIKANANGINSIICEECNTEYEEKIFKQINFN